MNRIQSWLLLLLLVLPGAPKLYAQSGILDAQDSLARLYVSATPAGRLFIVDQGRYKAIFNSEGQALTQFMYKSLRPGLDGRFLARIEHHTLLIDSAGSEIAVFAGLIDRVDSVHRFYRTREHNAMHFYKPDGSHSANIPLSYGVPTSGPFVSSLENSFYQGVIDSLNRAVLPLEYQSVQIGDAGISGMKGDSVFAFDLNGRLRFRTLGHESKMLGAGAVGVKLYGLWGVFDSSGRLRIPFSGHTIETRLRGAFVELDNQVLSLDGTVLSEERISYIDREPGGWHELHYENGGAEELRDAHFRVVLPKGSYGRLEFAGDRFIFVFAGYNDASFRVYDREAREFTQLAVERHIHGDAYLVYEPGSRSRRIMKGDSILPLPLFTDLMQVEGHPYFRITREDSGALGYRQKRERNERRSMQELLLEMRNAPVLPYGLLDSGMRLIVPLTASDIRILPAGLIYAAGWGKAPGAVYNFQGEVLVSVPAGNAVSMVGELIRIAGADGYSLVDTLGRTVYRSDEPPAVLMPDPQSSPEREAETLRMADERLEYPEIRDIMQEPLAARVPWLLLYDDSSGYSGLYDTGGRQLLPHEYYAVAQRIPGLHALKRGDSVYFVNALGRLMYGGRGFTGRNYHILESYSLLLRGPDGRWGSIDALGRTKLPFTYDSVYLSGHSNGTIQYMLVREGRYGVLSRNGELLYPPQTWKPERWIAADHIYGSDNRHYRLIDGQVMQVPADSVWGIEKRNQFRSHSYFRIESSQQGRSGGIFSRGGKLIAPWYPSFQYRENRGRMLITNEARSEVAVIDTTGTLLLPFNPNPAALVLADSAIVLIDAGGSDRLIYTDGRRQRRLNVSIDSAVRAHLLTNRQGQGTNVVTAEMFSFRTARGHWGIMNYNGRVLIDSRIGAIRHGDFVWRIERSGRWGLFEPRELRYIHPADADSIVQEHDGQYFRIWKSGRVGLYAPQTRVYLPPAYSQVYQPSTLHNGYLMIRVPEGYTIVNLNGERIAPLLDSMNADAPTIPATAAFVNAEEVSLAIGTDGRVVVERGMDAKIRRQGFDGSYAQVVILRSGSKFGLYSNEQYRMIVPLHYDAIDATGHGFVVWKYRPDKHQGMDSTLLLDSRGRVIRAMRGGYNPIVDDGFWYLRGHGYSPVLTAGGEEIIPDGYQVQHVERSRHFLVEKDEKLGIVSDTGTWLTPLVFDRLDPDQAYRSEARAATKEESGKRRVALIDRYGRQVTEAIYDEVRFDENQVLFRRGAVRGYLDAEGRERVGPVPKDDFEDE